MINKLFKNTNPSSTAAEEQLTALFSNVQMEEKLKKSMGRELIEKLKKGNPLIIKAGFDPSRPDLHLGHSLVINKLRQFQEFGHEVIFVVGDWTACIGDPSGQNKTRPLISVSEVEKNASSYIEQATRKNFKTKKTLSEDEERILSFFKRLDPEKTKWVYNSKWLDQISLRDFIISISSKFTVARQLERDDFSLRYKGGKPIGLHEFFYPVLQAYDSVELKADVEIGGTDQLFNLLLGRELQEKDGQSPQVVLTLPLLEGLDTKKVNETNWNIEGGQKMSKSLGNAICFNDSPKDIYGKVMSVSDQLLIKWWNIFTEGKVNLADIFAKENINPKLKKEELAWLLVCSFYGEEQANQTQSEFTRVFSNRELPSNIPEKHITARQEVWICKLIKELGLCDSTSSARRAIESGAVRRDSNKLTDSKEKLDLRSGDSFLLSFGRRKFLKVKVK